MKSFTARAIVLAAAAIGARQRRLREHRWLTTPARILIHGATIQAERSGVLEASASKFYLVEAAPGQAIQFRMVAEDAPFNLAVRLGENTIAEDSVYNGEYRAFSIEGKVFAPASGEIVLVLTNVGDAGTDYGLFLNLTD